MTTLRKPTATQIDHKTLMHTKENWEWKPLESFRCCAGAS